MPRPCTRCSSPASVYTPDARCTPCFRAYLQRTFKTSVGRLGAGGRPTGLALALSGGHSSSASALLLGTYINSLNPNPHAPPPRIVAFHVTQSEEPPAIVRHLCQRLPGTTLACVRLPNEIIEALARVKDVSDSHSLRRASIFRALLTAAREHSCETLLLGTSATRAAADVLHTTITARGTSVYDTAAASVSYDCVRVIRPLRDVPVRQLARYALLELPNADFINPVEGMRSGLYGIVERFIESAADDNAASVHNIVRTAGKLLPIYEERCVLCGGPVKSNGNGSADCGSCEGCECGESTVTLCVGCRDCIDRSAGDDSVLKLAKANKLEERRRQEREEMRKQVAEFLL